MGVEVMVVVEVVVVVDVVVAVGVIGYLDVRNGTGGEKVRARVRVRKGSTANRAEPS
jgi:hypothetical protein